MTTTTEWINPLIITSLLITPCQAPRPQKRVHFPLCWEKVSPMMIDSWFVKSSDKLTMSLMKSWFFFTTGRMSWNHCDCPPHVRCEVRQIYFGSSSNWSLLYIFQNRTFFTLISIWLSSGGICTFVWQVRGVLLHPVCLVRLPLWGAWSLHLLFPSGRQ